MRMAVFTPLLMLFATAIFAQLYVMGNITEVIDQSVDVGLPVQFFEFAVGSFVVSFNLASGAILMAMTGILIAVVAGIRGSISALTFGVSLSLSETSVSALVYGVTFFGAWMILSPFASPMFFMIPMYGIPLYFLLSLIYVIGVLEMMHMNA